jgi:hypothetical protein
MNKKYALYSPIVILISGLLGIPLYLISKQLIENVSVSSFGFNFEELVAYSINSVVKILIWVLVSLLLFNIFFKADENKKKLRVLLFVPIAFYTIVSGFVSLATDFIPNEIIDNVVQMVVSLIISAVLSYFATDKYIKLSVISDYATNPPAEVVKAGGSKELSKCAWFAPVGYITYAFALAVLSILVNAVSRAIGNETLLTTIKSVLSLIDGIIVIAILLLFYNIAMKYSYLKKCLVLFVTIPYAIEQLVINISSPISYLITSHFGYSIIWTSVSSICTLILSLIIIVVTSLLSYYLTKNLLKEYDIK